MELGESFLRAVGFASAIARGRRASRADGRRKIEWRDGIFGSCGAVRIESRVVGGRGGSVVCREPKEEAGLHSAAHNGIPP